METSPFCQTLCVPLLCVITLWFINLKKTVDKLFIRMFYSKMGTDMLIDWWHSLQLLTWTKTVSIGSSNRQIIFHILVKRHRVVAIKILKKSKIEFLHQLLMLGHVLALKMSSCWKSGVPWEKWYLTFHCCHFALLQLAHCYPWRFWRFRCILPWPQIVKFLNINQLEILWPQDIRIDTKLTWKWNDLRIPFLIK